MKAQFVSACVVALVFSASARIEMGTPFADGMVLQRGMKVPVWGTVVPDTEGLVSPSEGGPKIVWRADFEILGGGNPVIQSKFFDLRNARASGMALILK